ncbi:MAG TPA: hypothetical protein VHH12_10200 [Mycobacterium sp.]|nr:hypothetical protein [Mycobacterium sp.]
MIVKLRNFAMMAGMGAVAVAIALAPAASGASTTSTHDSGPVTTTQRPGHVSIYAEPPVVSPPKIYGPFSSPLFLLGD